VKRSVLGAVLTAALGATSCGDDAPPASDGTTGASGASDSTGGETSGGSTGADLGTSTGASTDTAAGTDADTTGDASSGTSAELDVDVDVVTYPGQPMVVDLVFSAPDLTATVDHATDPGVQIAVVEGDEDTTRVRVRGLAPQTEHTMGWLVSDDSGDAASGEVDFTTETALPGFVGSVPVGGAGPAIDGYVLFDMVTFGLQTPSAVLLVDPEGVTRWYLGVLDDVVGIPIVHAAATLRPDGTVSYVRGDTIRVVDELAQPVVELSAETLGVPGLHHELIELPSGNFLTLSYSFADVAYMDLGTVHVAGDLIVEVTPAGEVVWTWDTFDHLDPQRRRDGFDTVIVNPDTGQDGSDWTHGNGLIYDAATDTIVLSLRHQDWMVAIDHATGNVLWRLGDEGDFALTAGDWFFHPHSPQWQDDGTLLLYDNGVGNPTVPDEDETSRAVRYALNADDMTATLVWEDEAEDFVSAIAGDADRLADGTILVTDSAIDQGDGDIAARIRQIDEADSATPRWAVTTGIGQLVYRASQVDRFVGQPAGESR